MEDTSSLTKTYTISKEYEFIFRRIIKSIEREGVYIDYNPSSFIIYVNDFSTVETLYKKLTEEFKDKVLYVKESSSIEERVLGYNKVYNFMHDEYKIFSVILRDLRIYHVDVISNIREKLLIKLLTNTFNIFSDVDLISEFKKELEMINVISSRDEQVNMVLETHHNGYKEEGKVFIKKRERLFVDEKDVFSNIKRWNLPSLYPGSNVIFVDDLSRLKDLEVNKEYLQIKTYKTKIESPKITINVLRIEHEKSLVTYYFYEIRRQIKGFFCNGVQIKVSSYIALIYFLLTQKDSSALYLLEQMNKKTEIQKDISSVVFA